MPITLIGITFVVFCLTRMVPGGPVERLLQEQAISSLAGEKSIGVAATTQVSDADIERLEELFNLQEPVWLSYLQWLGIRRREVEIAKAEFLPDSDTTQVVVTSLSGHSAVIDVRREGKHPVYAPDPWFEEEGWRVRIESPRDRALRWAKRNDIEDEAQIAAREQHPSCSRWRAVAYRKAYDGLLQGQLGRSYKYNESVAGMMW